MSVLEEMEASARDSKTSAGDASDGDLPFGGDLQAAIRAQDRDAVRTLLAARASGAVPMAPQADAVDDTCMCPICHELLFKPTVNSCGHSFCFWCIHHSMDALDKSACPLCRAPFQHLPAPCLALHQHVKLRYPEESQRRTTDMLAREESEFNAGSLPLPESDAEPDWRCVDCGELARRPFVSVCGHVTCEACEVANKRSSCAACNARLVYRPKVCRLALSIFGIDNEESTLPSSPTSSSRANAAPASPASAPAAAAGVGALPTLSTVATPPQPPAYVHFGIGCDGCGCYPITGRAYRCMDCPEAIGFDLCEHCHGSSLSHGRFGQSHTPSHQMVERHQQSTWLHVLRAANPTMEVREILALAQLQMQSEPADDDDDVPAAGGGDADRFD